MGIPAKANMIARAIGVILPFHWLLARTPKLKMHRRSSSPDKSLRSAASVAYSEEHFVGWPIKQLKTWANPLTAKEMYPFRAITLSEYS